MNPDPIKTTSMDSVHAERIDWLWEAWVALGFLNLLTGPAGVGKSSIVYDLAARVSREGGNVLIATAEDHLAAIVRPRLEAAAADLPRVHAVTDELALPAAVERLRARASQLKAVLLVVDPLVAFLDSGTDSHKDASVRQALRPLAALAESLPTAVVAIVHTNKSASDDPLIRISGSGGFAAAARHVLLACSDPSDRERSRKVLAVVKSNLAPAATPLGYSIESAVIDGDDGPISTSRVRWGDPIEGLDPRSLLRSPQDPEERGKVDEAAEFLQQLRVAEVARSARDIFRDGEAQGIAKHTLQRARRELRIQTWKDGFEGMWMWGPRDAVAEGDDEGDEASVSPSSSSVRPAETSAKNPEGDTESETTSSERLDRRDERPRAAHNGSAVSRRMAAAGLGRLPGYAPGQLPGDSEEALDV